MNEITILMIVINKPRVFWKVLPLGIIALALIILCIIFFSRSPVLIITDNSFDEIYGSRRLAFRNIKTSLEIRRPVIPVTVMETAGADLAAFAALTVSANPYAVFFPYRYLEGAIFYGDLNPGVPVFITGGRNLPERDSGAAIYIQTDAETDLYRAGLYAAILAGDKDVLFASDRALPENYEAALLRGFLDQDFLGNLVFFNDEDIFESYNQIGSMIIFENTVDQPEFEHNIPVILFSWLDPSLTSRNVRLIFDDSPWVMVKRALDTEFSGLISLGSEPLLLINRLDNIFSYFGLNGLLNTGYR